VAQDVLFIHQHPSEIRVLPRDGMSGAAYVADMLNAVAPRLEAGIGPALQACAAAGLPLFEVPPQSALLDRVPETVRREVLRRIEGLNAFMGVTFVIAHDPPVKTWISWVEIEHPSGRGPSLIWVRKGQAGVLQIVLGNFDALALLAAIAREVAPEPKAALLHSQAQASVNDVLTTITDLSLSVSWALPPPWGAVATLGLSIFRMFMGTSDEHANPWKDLADGIKEFERQLQIENYSSDFSDFAMNLSAKTSAMQSPVSAVTHDARYFDDLHEWLYGGHGFDMVHNRLTHIYDNYLSKRDLPGCQDLLPLFVSGVTLYMTGRKLEMQIIACRAFAVQGIDDDMFFSYSSEWKRVYRELRIHMLGDAATKFTGFCEMVSIQIERIVNERLSQLTPPYRQPPEGHWGLGGAMNTKMYITDRPGAWNFNAGTGKQSLTDYSDTNGVHERDGDAANLFQEGRTSTMKMIEDITRRPSQIVAAWKTKLNEAEGMMPPSAPLEKPGVKPLADGDLVPQGDWKSGKTVCYAISLRNDKGPSDLGPWSDPMTIGATAFAEVTVSAEVNSHSGTIAWITRKFIDETARDEKTRIVGATMENQTIFKDKHK